MHKRWDNAGRHDKKKSWKTLIKFFTPEEEKVVYAVVSTLVYKNLFDC